MANRKAGSFIKIDRNIINWQWFKKPNHLIVWIYILVNANYQDGFFQGVEVKRGELAISYKNLAKNTGLSVQNVRTVIEHLISTGELTRRGHHDFTVLSVVNYDKYQHRQQAKQHPANTQPTCNQHATNNNQRNKEIYKERNIDIDSVSAGSIEGAKDFCLEDVI